MENDYVALLSKASFLPLIHPLTHWWQWDTMQGAGLTIGSSLRFSVLCPKDMWTGGSNHQSCDQWMTRSTSWATTALCIFLCVIEGGVCTLCRDKGVWSTVGSKSREMFMQAFFKVCVHLQLCMFVAFAFFPVSVCVCVCWWVWQYRDLFWCCSWWLKIE